MLVYTHKRLDLSTSKVYHLTTTIHTFDWVVPLIECMVEEIIGINFSLAMFFCV